MVVSFTFFDLLSPDISLYYKGKISHSSNLSAVLSIISIIITLIFSYIFAQDLKRKNPSAFYYNRFIKDITPIPFNSSGLFHLLNVTREKFPFEPNRIFSIFGISNYMYLFDFNDIESFDHYIYDYCEDIDIKGIEDIILENVYEFNKLFCIKRFYNKTTKKIYNLNNKEYSYPQIIYGASHPKATIYGIIVEKCKNSTIINNNNCYSNEIIEEALKSIIGYSIDFLDHNIIIDNYNIPNSNIYHTVQNLYNFGVGYTTNHLNFLPTMLRTNKGFFLDYIDNLNSYKFSFNEKLTTLFSEEENPNKGIYAAFYFWLQNQEDAFVRSYKKIQDVIGSITGVAKIIFICAKGLNLLIHNYIYINDVNNDLKNHYKLIIDKSTPLNNSSFHQFKFKNNYVQNNMSNKLNFDKSNIQMNYDFSNTSRITKHFQKFKYNKISFWRICKKFVFQKKDQFIKKIVELRKFIISEEIMFKYYFIIRNLKNPIFEYNNIFKNLDSFKDDNFMINSKFKLFKEQ